MRRDRRGSVGTVGHTALGSPMPAGPGDPEMQRTAGAPDQVRSVTILRNALLLGGVVFAVAASLTPDNRDASLELGATAAAFLALTGLVSLASRMPSLPPFVLPPRSTWQDRVHRARSGDRLARLEMLEALDRIEGEGTTFTGPLLRDRRQELGELSRADFDTFLSAELQRAEDLT